MVFDTEYYDLLEISPSASIEDIKKSYRKLAIKYHPDKNPGDKESEEKFKKIAEAYSVLSDPETRSKYDQFGKDRINRPNIPAEDIFSSIFGQIFGGASRRNRDIDIYYDLKLTLLDLYKGRRKRFEILRKIMCDLCLGKGYDQRYPNVQVCEICNGRKRIITQQRSGPFVQIREIECKNCSARGYSIPDEIKCQKCNKSGTQDTKEVIEIQVKPGMFDGQKVTVDNKGHFDLSTSTYGNLIFNISEIPDKVLKRTKNTGFEHLYMDISISLADALTGYVCQVDHPGGSFNFVCEDIIKPSSLRIVEGKGMPLYGTEKFGNLYIKFDVQFPKTLSIETQSVLSNILPDKTDFSTIDQSLSAERANISNAKMPSETPFISEIFEKINIFRK